MWTKSKDYNVRKLTELAASPVLVSPEFKRQSEGSSNSFIDEKEFNMIVALQYTIIPSLRNESEKVNLLRWVLSRWSDSVSLAGLRNVPLQQAEFFFVGTENGQLFIFPLVPLFTLKSVVQLFQHEEWCGKFQKDLGSPINNNCGPRRLLHRHAREEPVSSLHVLGSLVASSSDGSVALSSFYPVCRPITLITQPFPVRSIKLWEGKPFSNGLSSEELKKRGETAAVYIFSGDERGVVRLWRVNVLAKNYTLLHVFLMSPSYLKMHSSLDIALREDAPHSLIEREPARTVHCMTLDNDERLLVGVEGSVYCWAINELPWKEKFDQEYHPLQWSQELHDSLLSTSPSLSQVRLRAERLVNHHVWVRDHRFVSASISKWAETSLQSASERQRKVCRWKPKHQRNIAGGVCVGVVSNEVEFFTPRLLADELSTSSILSNSLVTVSFEEGELHNDVVLPVGCVEPVVYPLTRLTIPIGACFAMELLENGRRLITYTSNNYLTVWSWEAEKETYIPFIVVGEENSPRGLGKNICILRSPDIFLTSGYDDGLVKEWHLYEKPLALLQCERRFTLQKCSQFERNSDDKCVVVKEGIEECVDGISAMFLIPSFGALFVVGLFEDTIQTFRFAETQGCEVPPNFLYNGLRTIQIPSNLHLDEYMDKIND